MAFIVLIDDDDRICALFARILKRDKHEVATAADGAQGLELCRQRKPDLVVVDMYMPGMDGIEVIQKIRALSDIPIIAMSGGGLIGSLTPLSAARHLRAAVLQKPVSPPDLLAAVNQALENPAD